MTKQVEDNLHLIERGERVSDYQGGVFDGPALVTVDENSVSTIVHGTLDGVTAVFPAGTKLEDVVQPSDLT